jgi:hypothetical protein
MSKESDECHVRMKSEVSPLLGIVNQKAGQTHQ